MILVARPFEWYRARRILEIFVAELRLSRRRRRLLRRLQLCARVCLAVDQNAAFWHLWTVHTRVRTFARALCFKFHLSAHFGPCMRALDPWPCAFVNFIFEALLSTLCACVRILLNAYADFHFEFHFPSHFHVNPYYFSHLWKITKNSRIMQIDPSFFSHICLNV